jgi:hypothetical protein
MDTTRPVSVAETDGAGGALTPEGEVGLPPQPATAPAASNDAAWQACTQN